MISTHEYAATLLEGAGYDLPIKGGTVNLDESRAPHVEATLTIPVPDETLSELLDAREARRVEIELSADYLGAGSKSRTANLGLRARRRTLETGMLELTLASDEALLIDDVLGGDTVNTDALAYQSSLRAILDNVILDRIGASLQPGTDDAPFYVLTDAVNLVKNPRLAAASTYWSHAGAAATATRQTVGGPAGCPTFWRSTMTGSNPPAFIISYDRTGLAVSPTTDYIVSIYVRCSVAATFSMDWLVYNSGGALIQDGPDRAPFAVPANTWVRVAHAVSTPALAASASVRLFTSGTTLGSGVTLDATGLVVSADDHVLGSDLNTYYDGDTTDTGDYAYAWTGTPNDSTSTRTALIDRSPELLHWKPGVSAWEFIQPVFQAAGMRLFCDEQRRWYLVDGSTYIAAGSQQFSDETNLIEANDEIARDNDEWYDAASVTYRWIDGDTGTVQERIDYFAEPGATRTKTWVIERPYPGPGFAEYAVKRAAGKGRTLDLTAVSLYDATPSQPVTVTLPDTPIQTGVLRSVTFDLTDDRMRLTTRGLTDTPPDAYVFGDPSKRYIDIPVGMTYNTFDWGGF